MTDFYFFKKDGKCRWMEKEIKDYYPLILHGPVSMTEIKSAKGLKLTNPFEGKIRFYVILDWVFGKNRGVNLEWLDEMAVNYVKTTGDLPENSGVYVTGYDSDIEEVGNLIKKGVPLIDHACPWIRKIKEQLNFAADNGFQIVFLIDAGHMVYNCYKSVFPDDIIIVSPENYAEEILGKSNEKPKYFISYAVFRIKEAERISVFINEKFPGKGNITDGYKRTSCCWIKQGLMEEIEMETGLRKLEKIWVVCSSVNDRSTISIFNEIKEAGAVPVPIKNPEDIPEIKHEKNIGVILAPIPLSGRIKNIMNTIRIRYNEGIDDEL